MYHQINPTETFRERQLLLLTEAENRRLTRRLRAGRVRKSRSRRAMVLGILASLVVVTGLVLVAPSSPAHADGEFIFKVNSTPDLADASINRRCAAESPPGVQCTLRAAIQESNATPEKEIIAFYIPATDPTCGASAHVCTIFPGTVLPPITQLGTPSTGVSDEAGNLLDQDPSLTGIQFKVRDSHSRPT